MRTKSQTLSHTLFIGSVHRIASLARLLGEGLRLLGYSVRVLWYGMRVGWFWVNFVWVWLRALFFWWLFLVLVWDFTELLGIPLIQDLKAELHKGFDSGIHLFVKEDPAKIREKALAQANRINKELAQAHCRHITRRNGLWNYFCPLCGKKLIPGDHPWWQV